MLLGYTKVSKKTSSVGSCVHGKNSIYFEVNETLWITLHTAKHYYSTLLSVILRLFIKNGWHGWRASCIWTVNFKRLQEVALKEHSQVWDNFWLVEAFQKNDEKCFLFHLKSSSLVLKILKFFVLNFRSCQKTAWIER